MYTFLVAPSLGILAIGVGGWLYLRVVRSTARIREVTSDGMTFEPISGRPTVTLNWESIRSLAVVQGGFWPHTTFQTEFGIFRVFPGNDAVQLARLAEASSHVRPN